MVSISGQTRDAAALKNQLIGALIGLARATEGNDHMITDSTYDTLVEGLLTVSNAGNMDTAALLAMTQRVTAENQKLVPECFRCACPCGRTFDYDMGNLQNAEAPIRDLKLRILACCCSLAQRGTKDLSSLLYWALYAVGMDDWEEEDLLPIYQELKEALCA